MNLLTEHLATWIAADTSEKSARGRSAMASLYGVKKLRELILELAVRGLLVPQNPTDEPASELLKKIAAEKVQLVKEGKIKAQKPLAPIEDDEKPFDLPKGWEWVKLGEVLSISSGDGLTSSNMNTGNVPVYGGNGVTGYHDDYNVNKPTLVIGRVGYYCGSIHITPSYAWVTDNAFITTFSEHNIFINFLYWLLKATDLKENENATAQPVISGRKIYPIGLPLPPLAEQHRIVAKVDELMALCDQLENQQNQSNQAHQQLVTTLLNGLTSPKSVHPELVMVRQAHHERLDNITSVHPELVEGLSGSTIRQANGSPQTDDFQQAWQRINSHFDTLFTTEDSIDALKQSILQLAVMGKLVAQNPTDEPASELLKRIAAEKARLVKEGKIKAQKPLAPIEDDEKPFDLPKGWEWVRLGDVSQLITSGSRDWAQYLSNDGAKFITMSNLSRGSYQLRLDNMRYVNPPSNGEGSRTKLEADDLVISITGDVGNLGRIPESFGDAYINQHACLVRFVTQCRNRYFPELLRSPMAVLQFNAPQRGVKNSFRLGDVGEMIVSLPPVDEQQRIVAKVDELMALCEQLKNQLNQAKHLQGKIADVLVEQALV